MKSQNWGAYKSKIEERVQLLKKDGYYLEIVFLLSVVLERELKDLIFMFEEVSARELKSINIRFCPQNNPLLAKKEQMTLGRLKNYLNIYCDDENIMSLIGSFNKIRIKSIHRLLDENIGDLEEEILNFQPKFYTLMERLVDIEIELINKEARVK